MVPRLKTFLQRTADVLLCEPPTVVVLLGLLGLLLSAGFLFGTVTHSNFGFIVAFASPTAWSLGFAVYGILKLAQLFTALPHLLKVLNGAQGLWAWTYVLLSFTVFDTSPLAPTEFLLAVPIILELWELAANIFNYRTCPSRKRKGL